MQMSEAKRKALTIPPPRKPSAAQIKAHSRFCVSSKQKTIIPPDAPPYAEKALKAKLRGR